MQFIDKGLFVFRSMRDKYIIFIINIRLKSYIYRFGSQLIILIFEARSQVSYLLLICII